MVRAPSSRVPVPRLHGGLAGALVAIVVVLVVAVSSSVLHAPLFQTADRTPALRGPRGFATGWRREGDLHWQVLSERAVHDVLVVRLEMPAPDRARDVVDRLLPLTGGAYREMLFYVYRPGRGDHLADRRVRWTAAHGLEELVLRPAPGPGPPP